MNRKGYGSDWLGTNLPETSLLICSRNRHQMLWETIQSILAGREIPAEIVVVDQSDTPDLKLSSFQPGQNCTFRYLWSEKKGVSLGRNMAATNAAYPIVVITDDDMFVSATWFGSLVRALVAGGTRSVITGRVLASDEGIQDGFAASIKEDERPTTYRGRIDKDVLFTGNMAIYRSAFDSVGKFDERLGPGSSYPSAEDNDLGFRLLEADCTIFYEPIAAVFHRSWRSKREFLWLHWSYGLGQGAFYAKYFDVRDMYMIKRMTRVVVNHLIRLPYRFLYDRAQAFRDIFFVAGILVGATQWTIRQSREKS